MSNTELTPGRIRDAAEVLQAWATGGYTRTVRELREYADKLERAEADKARREQRIEEIALEAFAAHYGVSVEIAVGNWTNANRSNWCNVARVLIDRYPALAEVSIDE